jgi:hypothetical protein
VGGFFMYLDPGFGSMVIQIIIASIATFSAYFIVVKRKAFAIFRRKNSNVNNIDEKGK